MTKKPKHFLLPDYKQYLSNFECVLSGKQGVELHHTIPRSRGYTYDNSLIPIHPSIHYLIHHGKDARLTNEEYHRYRRIVKLDLRIIAVNLFSTWAREVRQYEKLVDWLDIHPDGLEELTTDYLKEQWLEKESN